MIEVINLRNLNKKAIKNWLESFDVILTDCDAVLWHDNVVIPQVPETINALKTLGKKVYFVTNNGTKTRHDIWQKACKMNYQIKETEIIAPTYSIAEYLKQNLKHAKDKVYVIGSEAVAEELNNFNIENFGIGEDLVEGNWVGMLESVKNLSDSEKVGAVVVGFDDHFSFVKMLKASSFISSNKECYFLATNADTVHRYPKYCIPGTGTILKALETCLEKKPKIMGKPNPIICQSLIKSGLIQPKRTLMIGDCAKVDVVFGKNCGFKTLLVGSGRYKWPEVQHFINNIEQQFVPDYYLDSLGGLHEYLS